ncbi:hypothetical protein [Haloarcula sp. Atlit-120R]|uniref:hypothetical protein n=1 Tax=Haloarcula sp. Atlit-120R TaxID=2282135 RepID=UPI0011C36D40|nr:hypothetical protein [Haloarcula sp. Atlit-120R]
MYSQLPYEIPVVPQLLPSIAIFFGFELLLLWYFNQFLNSTAAGKSGGIQSNERTVIVGTMTIGYLFLMTAIIRQYSSISALSLYLFFLAQTIEGAASLRLYKKVVDIITRRHSSNIRSSSIQSIYSRIYPRIKYSFLILFIISVTISFIVFVITRGPVVHGTAYDIALAYTVGSFLIAALGVTYRVRGTPQVFNKTSKLGVVLCLAGANIYDYQTITGEIVAFSVGAVGYTIGFWLAALFLLKSGTSPIVSFIRRMTPIGP